MIAPEVVEGEGSGSGKAIGLAVLLLPAVIYLWRAIVARTPSRRDTLLAALCGFLLLAPVGYGSSPAVSITFGVLRALVCVTGLFLVIRALVRRRRDRGVGVVGPLLAAGLCLLHGLVALFQILPAPAMSAAQGESWVYRSEEEEYELTLPSEHWVREKRPGASAWFRCRTLPARVAVQLDRETAADHARRVRMIQANDLPNLRAAKSESGKTPAGHDYFLAGGYEQQPTKELFVTTAYVHRGARTQTIALLSEATLTTTSAEDRAAQEAALLDAVRSMARSLR